MEKMSKNKPELDLDLYTQKVSVDKLKPGDITPHDILIITGGVLIKAGTLLTEQHIEKLKPISNKVVTLNMRKLYKKSMEKGRRIFAAAAEGKPVVLKEVEDFVAPYVDTLQREINVAKLLSKLQSKDEYTFQHTINIGVIAMAFGKWIGIEGEELHNLAIAGTLHDIGKSKIPLNILNKPGPLTADEFEVIKNHPVYGHEIIEKSSDYDETIKLAILQHHERINGEGYPYNLKDRDIHRFAKIVAVADTYHAMTSTRVYKGKKNPYAALQHLQQNIEAFDPEITLTFIERMLSSLQSSKVLLNNGMSGDVIYIDKQIISKPLVKIDEQNTILDLKERKDLSIIDVVFDEGSNL